MPGNDPTLLFTNAGMVQFKDVFLGKEKRAYTRAATSQRCVRAGGKHNDLENVGYTARHHTFFEMLGNFSFGDYFKREAIRFAWEFVTGKLQLDPERLWVTVFRDDDEAAKFWVSEAGVPAARVTRMGEKSNFWAMGDTGPCGPCSEIFYDHGPKFPAARQARLMRTAIATSKSGIWCSCSSSAPRAVSSQPLPKPSVDTGMGLERLAAVMQGVHSNYDIDLFKELIQAAADATGTEDHASPSLRVIADHIRACTFLIIDGVVPSNEGRGYVLRRIIRRAMRHGYKLGQSRAFFYKLVPVLARVMGEAYPELRERSDQIAKVLRAEEERFAETLESGMAQFEARMAEAGGTMVPGSLLFLLHDTYGFPPDLTADIARERNLQVDLAGYDREMELQRERARAASKFGVDLRAGAGIEARSEFLGYDTLEADAKVLALRRDGALVQELQPGQSGEVVLSRTPFYAESGGQVGDTGELLGEQAPALRLPIPRSWEPQSCIPVRSPAVHCAWAMRCRRGSTRRGARRFVSITRRPTCCTRRFARCWESTSRKRALWSRPIDCGSTSRIFSRSLRMNWPESSDSSTPKSERMRKRARASWTTSRPWPPVPSRCSARSTNERCGC